MKKYFLVLTALAALFAVSACNKGDRDGEDPEDDLIIDWAPVDIYIDALDADGNSIISPEMPGMTLTFKGETYTVQDWSHRSDIFTPRDCQTKE